PAIARRRHHRPDHRAHDACHGAAGRSFYGAGSRPYDRLGPAERRRARSQRHRSLSRNEVERSGHGPREVGGSKEMNGKLTRRSLTAGLALGAIASPGLGFGLARAQTKSVKMAMIVPLSGPWARQGQLLRQGAEMAIDEINQKGGIEKLGGAKFELVVGDAGDSTEKAKNAAQRLLSDQPDLIGGFGSWLSSFTLAVTEVTERAELPWLTLSYSDAITNR